MKKVFLSIALMVLTSSLFSQSFVSPINFVSNETNKQKVIAFIKSSVKAEYTKIGMGDPATLRMMENENLKAFKELVKVSDKKLLQSIIDTYCEIGMCNYTTFIMMYNEQFKAKNQSLEW